MQLLRLPVPAWPDRADRLRDQADQIIGELTHPAIPVQASHHRSFHIPTRGLAIYSGLPGHPAQP